MKSKILFFGMSENLGGIEVFIINFWRKIKRENIQIDFVKTSPHICFENELLLNGSKVYTATKRNTNILVYIYKMYVFFKNNPQYTIIHFHQNTCSNIEPAIIAKIFGKKIIFHSHSEWKGDKKITKLLHYINRQIWRRS